MEHEVKEGLSRQIQRYTPTDFYLMMTGEHNDQNFIKKYIKNFLKNKDVILVYRLKQKFHLIFLFYKNISFL